jgi:hypothetical protein
VRHRRGETTERLHDHGRHRIARDAKAAHRIARPDAAVKKEAKREQVFVRRLCPALWAGLFALLACHDERANPHAYASAPPPAAARGSAATPSVPEPPMGTKGGDARITAVVDAATGTPAALTDVTASIDVMTIVARGPGRPHSERARVELVVRGTRDTTLVLELEAPAPTIVAHSFHLDVAGSNRDGIRPGRYAMHVRIIGGDGHAIAVSLPLYVEVRALM